MSGIATRDMSAPAQAPPALTALVSGSGCGCKLAPGALLPLLARLPAQAADERLLVDAHTSDDAGAFALTEELALVQTLDFFTPPVDDPYDFGRIAAANALSDVYAMGARPLTALNIVAFPLERLGGEVLAEVLRGGLDVCAQAGVLVVGGHSVDDPEPKYGLAVTGVCHPDELLTNAGGAAGDALVLTKPLGVGAIVAAHKRGAAGEELLQRAADTMVELNADASAAALAAGAHAVTDVTGFGLLGHLHHLCRESAVAAELYAGQVPALEGVRELLESSAGTSGGSRRNAEWAAGFTTFAHGISSWRHRLLVDPTTSGGLLVALPQARAAALPGVVVGRLLDGAPGSIRVVSGAGGS
jgi:selenide,water dikinase